MTLTGIGGNANVNTNGYPVMFSATLSGPGGLNKLGSNTLTIVAGYGSTYTGPTDIMAGTLAMSGSGSLASSSIDCKPGRRSTSPSSVTTTCKAQTLLGTGTVNGNVTADAVRDARAGDAANPIGTLTVKGNLTFSGGAIYDLPVGPASQGLVNVTGNLRFGTTAVLDVCALGIPSPGEYQYPLFTVGGSIAAAGLDDRSAKRMEFRWRDRGGK